MDNILKSRTLTYNLWSQTDFMRGSINARSYGLNSLSYFAPKVRDVIPLELKDINSLQKSKTEIRKWPLENLYLSAIHIEFRIC